MIFVSFNSLPNFQLRFDYSLLSFFSNSLVFRVNSFILGKNLRLFLRISIFKIHVFSSSLIVWKYDFLFCLPLLQVLAVGLSSLSHLDSTCQVGRVPSRECGVSLVVRAGSLRADWAHCSGEGTVGEEPDHRVLPGAKTPGFLGSAQSPLGWWSLGTKRARGSRAPARRVQERVLPH